MIATDYIFGKKPRTIAPAGFHTDGLNFHFDSKIVDSYNSNNPDRWTDLVTGNYLVSNASEKYNTAEGALNLTAQGNILTANTPINVPPGELTFGFYAKILNIYDVAGGIFRSDSTSRGHDWWFFYSNDRSSFVRVDNDSFMGDGPPEYIKLNTNHYYSFSLTPAIDGIYRSGILKTYIDGVLWHQIGSGPGDSSGITAVNQGFPIHVFNRQYSNNGTIGQFIKSLHSYNKVLTDEEMLANSEYLHSIHG